MHDLVIRGGTIVDGTGSTGYAGDLAIDGGRIAQVGGKAGPGRREVSAAGLLVTPGWVDVHTHYDGQATWDGELAPSSWHGATTIMFGNCGVGFAPVRREHHDGLIQLMEGVEDIPGIALAEGLKWDWESFPQYLDALSRLPRVIDVAAQMPHHALRVYVMGERGIARERATADDIAAMSRLTEEALRAGAFGFTTSRTESHRTPTGEAVPARHAAPDELLGIGEALGRVGRGAFGMVSDFEDEAAEFRWLSQLARSSGRPVWFLLTDRAYDPERWRRLMAGVREARGQGAQVAAQVAARPVGVIVGFLGSLNPFTPRPSYAALAQLPPAERIRRLNQASVREAILREEPSAQLLDIMTPLQRAITTRWDRIYTLGDPPEYEPDQERSIAALAARGNRPPAAVAYDCMLEDDGRRMLFFPITNYVTGDHEPIRQMLSDPATIVGLSDGGAHCGMICDASSPTYLLTHWARDRQRGPRLPLEWLVKRQTGDNARYFGFNDRGVLAPGKKADFNLIDFAGLRLHAPQIVYDLPAGGRRLVQRVDGYEMTAVSGRPIFERGQATGAMPGKLVRAGGRG
ncbi:MAG: amidohydrolase family protein [Alphaproteobacteria bacterium]|nr:amidohydrolase family protein [Alphaproteobacteria bacterium]